MGNPRVKVTLSERSYWTIRKLSEKNGQSMSALIGEMVEMIAPNLGETLELLEAAEAANDGTKAQLLGVFERLQEELFSSVGASQLRASMETAKIRSTLARQSKAKAKSKAKSKARPAVKKRSPKGRKGA